MLSLFPSDVLLDVIIRRALFSAFTGALWLLIAMIAMKLFMVKNPAVKYVFYTLALAKSFLALVRVQPEIVRRSGSFIVGVQAPNPLRILPDLPETGRAFLYSSSSFATGSGVAVLAMAMIFLLWRFLGLVRFYRIITSAPEVDREQHKMFFATLDRLVEKAHIANPKIISISSSGTPFTVGLRRPVIAFSPSLLKQLDQEEIEAVLAHEVGHIIRRDNLYHWPIVVMRDILFFNPFAHVIYRRLTFERERACDDFGSKLSQPLTLAKSLVKIAEIRASEPALGPIRSFAPQSFLAKQPRSYFSQRVTALLEPKQYGPLSRPRQVFFWLGAFIFIYLEIHVVALIHGIRVVFS